MEKKEFYKCSFKKVSTFMRVLNACKFSYTASTADKIKEIIEEDTFSNSSDRIQFYTSYENKNLNLGYVKIVEEPTGDDFILYDEKDIDNMLESFFILAKSRLAMN